jgi:hypothetical protein
MPKISRSGDGRQGRRQARQVARNLRHEAEKQAAAASSFTEQYRRWQRKRLMAGGLIALGVVVVFTHVFVHLRNIEWLPTTGMQDLVTGYPMGGLLILIGMILLPRS